MEPEPPARSPVSARLVTSAPEGLLRLEFTPPPGVTWTLVRAELARRLAEQAVSQAATVSDSDLATFARGRGLPRRPTGPDPLPAPVAEGPARIESAVEPAGLPTPVQALAGMLTGEALAEQLGVSRATVALRRGAGRLLALESGTKRGFRYPTWQVKYLRDPATRVGFEDALRVLAPRGAWATYRFLTEPATIGGTTPLGFLDAGDLPAFRQCLRASAG